MIELPTKPTQVVAKATENEHKRGSWQRLALATVFVSLGVVAAAIGSTSIGYRFTHIVVDNGLINSRIVRLQAPVSGNVKALYARPGMLVRTGQVLARIGIERTPAEEQLNLQLERFQDDQIRSQMERAQLAGELQANTAQLTTAKQSLVYLRQQLQLLENQYSAVQGVDVSLAVETVSQQKAALDAAVAKAEEARSNYDRYNQLQQQGAISALATEQFRFAWQSAKAEVVQAKARVRSAEASLNAAKDGVALSNQNTIGGNLSNQRAQLKQQIQAQTVLISTLQTQVLTTRNRMNQAQSLYKNRPSLVNSSSLKRDRQMQVVTAPFSGVVYNTEREQGEQVNQLEPVLTLLDCNDLWIETVVRADQAGQIDTQKPVRVRLNDNGQTVVGEIDLIQPISAIQAIEERSKLMQVQALLPAIPPTLVGQPLVRITVRIPPPAEHSQSQRFCGIGQSTSLTFSKK